MRKILIIGKIPPPIGGVCIHVSRLMEALETRHINFGFYNLRDNNMLTMFSEISTHHATHLHTSNPWLQLLTAIYCRVNRKPLIITYHGNWDRFYLFKNLAVKISAKLASVPLVQNDESLSKALKFNVNALLVSAFIVPLHITPLSEALHARIRMLRKSYCYIFCTNAWNITFDKHGKEIYGVSELIENMVRYRNSALIISDPSGNYQKFIEKEKQVTLPNIFWISEPHDFLSVLKLSDAFVRNTTTDGTALSIVESLWCGVPAFASSVVSRPAECITYRNLGDLDFEEKLGELKLNLPAKPDPEMFLGGIEKIVSLYRKILH